MQLVKTQKILYNHEFRIRLLADNNDSEYLRLIRKLPDCRWSYQLNSWHTEYIENHNQYFNKIFPSYIRFIASSPSCYIPKIDENIPDKKNSILQNITDLKSYLQNADHSIEFESVSKVDEDCSMHPAVTKLYDEKFREYLVSANYSIRTIEQYVNYVSRFLSSSQLNSGLSIEGIRDYVDEMSINRNLSRSYQNQQINSLKAYYRFKYGKGIGRFELHRPRRDSSTPVILTKNEVSKIIKVIPNLKHNTLIYAIYQTGITLGETVSLRPEDIDKEKMQIFIRERKNSPGRNVPVSGELLEKIDCYQNCYHPQNYLFEGYNGSRYSERSIQKVLKKYVLKAGINKKASVQTLRHSFACNLASRGIDISELQHILGHSSRKSTGIYCKMVENNIIS